MEVCAGVELMSGHNSYEDQYLMLLTGAEAQVKVVVPQGASVNVSAVDMGLVH